MPVRARRDTVLPPDTAAGSWARAATGIPAQVRLTGQGSEPAYLQGWEPPGSLRQWRIPVTGPGTLRS